MFKSVSIILVIDHDTFSSSSLSREIRKLGLAKTIVCLKSASNALAYLEKQQTCGYPFPEMIFYNPHKSDLNMGEFMETYRVKFSENSTSKIVLLEERNHRSIGRQFINNALIAAEIRKPIYTEQLYRLFHQEIKEFLPREYTHELR